MTEVYIGLGTNRGKRLHNIQGALERLDNFISVEKVSSLYLTQPVGVRGGWFINCVAKGYTDKKPTQLLEYLLDIEREMGRVRGPKEKRTIDLDIVLFGSEILDLGHRHIPDPELLAYPHVAVPVADLAPQFVHPETGQTLQEIVHGMDLVGLNLRPEIKLWQQPQE